MAYILLVDDQPESISMAAKYLSGKGHRAVVVTDGRAAIARIRQEAPEILVTDVLMPFADGFEIIQELQHRWPRDTVQVLVLTYIAADGEPVRDWARLAIDGYVLCHSDAEALGWQIVLAVEQFLHQRDAD